MDSVYKVRPPNESKPLFSSTRKKRSEDLTCPKKQAIYRHVAGKHFSGSGVARASAELRIDDGVLDILMP